MAEVTKPIALDESFNTTENTSRNVADVLAEGLDAIADAVAPKYATEIPMSPSDPDFVADRITALEKANDSSLLYKPTVTEPTLTNGNNHNHRTYYYKHNTRVCLSLGVSGLNTGLSSQILFVLPVGYRPRLSLSLIGCGYSFDKSCGIQILDNGTVIVQYTQDQGCFAYIEFDAYA